MKLKFMILLTIFLGCIMSLSAIDIKFSEDTLVETRDQDSDYVFAGEELQFKGKGDNLYFFGKKLNFTGELASGLTAFGERITLNGIVNNDTQIGAQYVDILGDVNGSLFIGGEDVDIDESSTITGDLLTGAKKLTIYGVVDGDLYVGAGKVVIEGIVKGNLYAKTGKIIFGEKGRVEGNLEYSSDWELTDSEKAKVNGTVQFKEWDKDEFFKKDFEKEWKWIWPVIRIIFILSFLIGGLLLLIFPVSKVMEEDRNERQFLYTTLWGLIPFFVYPVLILLGFILSIAFGLTAPIALVLLSAGFPLLVLTQIVGITLFGQLLFKLFKWEKKSRHLFFLFGLVFAVIISLIPFLSVLGFIFFSAAGWGRLLEGIFKVEFGKEVEATV
jgi:cytoskeletal protein CcmA (bactofilin family)